jgi:hypothetical protein
MFKPGNKHSKGRVLGSKNKSSTTLKKQIQKLLDDNMGLVQDDLDRLKPLDRLKIMIDLFGYVMPKLKSIQAEVTSITDMSDEKIDRLQRMSDLMLEIEADRINPDANILADE